jgi:hypothetical protein
MTTRYPSRQEVASHQRDKLQRLIEATVSAKEKASASPGLDYLAVLGERDHAATAFLADQVRFLRQIFDHQQGGLASHYKALGIGIEKGNALLRELRDAGYLVVHEDKSLHRAGGRPRKVPALTPLGIQMLQATSL